MARKQPTPVMYPTELVLAAACAAYRARGGYSTLGDIDEQGKLIPPNKQMVREFMVDGCTLTITDEDRELAKEVRTYYQSMTLQLLTERRMSDFDQTCMEIANGEEVSAWRIGQAAYMPQGLKKWRAVRSIDDRLYECRNEYAAAVGAKVNLSIEVLKSVWSNNWGCYYNTAITKDNFNVFFPCSTDKFQVGQTYSVTAKVKHHREGGQTVLNYVKIA